MIDAAPAAAPVVTSGETRRAARNASAMAAARILSSGLLFAWQLILARVLGDADLGVYGTVSALIGIGAALTSLSMSLVVIRECARHPEQAGRYLTITLFAQTALAGIAYLLLNSAAAALGYESAIRAYAAVAAISLFIDAIGNMAYDQLLARERMVSASLVDVAHILARIAVAGLALWAGFGLLGVYVATLASGIGRAAGLWAFLRRAGVTPIFPLDRALMRRLLIDSAPLALAALINITYTQIDRLMTTRLLTTADTGHLTAAFTIVIGVVEVLNTTILIAVYPMMARAYTPGGDPAAFRRIVARLASIAVGLSVPLVIGVNLFAPLVIVPIFGERFAPTVDILRVLIVYAAITMIVNVFAQALMVQNQQRMTLAIRAGGLALKLTLNVILLPMIGVVGAAAASVASEALVLALIYARGWRARRPTPTPAG